MTETTAPRSTDCLAGFRCPQCGNEESFHIGYTMHTVLLTFDDGTPDLHGDLDYDLHCVATCTDCPWTGTVNDLYLAHDAQYGTSNGTPRMTPEQAVTALFTTTGATGLHEHAATAAVQTLSDSWDERIDDQGFTVEEMVRDINRTIGALTRYRNRIA